jgi:cell division protein FtsN
LGIGLSSVINVWVTSGGHTFSQEKSPASVKIELVNDFKVDKAAEPKPTGTYKPIERSQTEVTAESSTGYIKTELSSTPAQEQIALADFKQHWFFSLAFSHWREKYQIKLADEVDRQAGKFFLQLGLYRRQQSLRDFFVAEVLPAEAYYFCYQKKNNLMALITGSYESVHQAYNAHNELQTQGFASSVITVNKLNDWQCSN